MAGKYCMHCFGLKLGETETFADATGAIHTVSKTCRICYKCSLCCTCTEQLSDVVKRIQERLDAAQEFYCGPDPNKATSKTERLEAGKCGKANGG